MTTREGYSSDSSVHGSEEGIISCSIWRGWWVVWVATGCRVSMEMAIT